tara:strand:- start:12171 stop:13823 length:1653 start_codon:yes stop_codon:yes gene_type:complete
MLRRTFLTKASLASSALVLPKYSFSMAPVFEEYVQTETSYGKIRGLKTNGVNIFKGIPYAGKVSGERRFKRPGDLKPWTGVKDALTHGAPAIQPPRRGEPEPSEDCLFLNVWTPANDDKKRAVMFYSHGGGFVGGSGGAAHQDGANLARNFDVVVVQTNHRLGLLGFLYLDDVAGAEYAGSGNMGILDITEGLKWVHENIAEFGGDPDNVMIFGESGGGAKTSCLYAMPEAAPYFSKASIESGPGVRMLTQETAQETTLQLLHELDIPVSNWKKLLDLPADELLRIQGKLPFVAPFQEKNNTKNLMEKTAGGFGPVVDGKVLPHHPFDPKAPEMSKNKPLLVGWNEDEYTFFAWERKDTDFAKLNFDTLINRLEPQFGADSSRIIEAYRKSRPNASAPDIFIAISSINMMGLGSIEIAEKKVKQGGAPVYLYNFGYKSEKKIPGTDYAMGTPHAMDISFKFNNEVPPKEGEGEPGSFFGGNRSERFQASHNFAALWTNFAKTSRPFAKDVPTWPSYDLETRRTMIIDTDCKLVNDRFSSEIELWKSIGKI